MFNLPSIPAWDAFHPGISHFPIVLLLVAPVFILAGVLSQTRRRHFVVLAFWFMVAGTLGVYLSAATGDAAKELAPKTPEITKAIETHENIASVVRAVFTVLTLLLGSLLYGPGLLKKQLNTNLFTWLTLLFLLLYGAGLLPLYNAAHSGGLLVHQHGVHAKP